MAATWPWGSDRVMVKGLAGRQRRSAFEDDAQPFHLLRGPGGEVEQGALFDLAAVAIALAQQYGWRRIAVGDGLDVHG